MSNDFILSEGGGRIELVSKDLDDWRITFVDTGLHSSIGERLLRVRDYVESEDVFLANYADGLTDLPLDEHIADFQRRGVVASMVAVPTAQSFHIVRSNGEGIVTGFGPIRESDVAINVGFFCLRAEIFDYMEEGEDLVEEPFQRLIAEGQLSVYRYLGFWKSMDTFKDKIALDRMEGRGDCPWKVWENQPGP
jgi:glucose-1-phosphate cytidylyltransferase